jgi:hypothetical protein
MEPAALSAIQRATLRDRTAFAIGRSAIRTRPASAEENAIDSPIPEHPFRTATTTEASALVLASTEHRQS